MKKLLTFAIIITTAFNSCQKDSGASSNDVYVEKVKGYVQKGPYINGTSITLYKLNNNLEQQGTSYSSNILDNKGTFELSSLNFPSKYVLFYANGFYFNEVSGVVSAAPLQLYSLADITNAASINVNVMTHLERRRVEYLVKQGQTFTEAKKIAQQDILNIFGFTIPSIQASEKLDINVTGDENAILLAISLILQGNLSVGDFSELLSTLSADLEQDGKLENTTALEKLKSNVFALNLPNIRKNLESRYQSLGLTASIPNFEKYIQQYLSTFPIDITTGLVAYYPFNGNANDESGNGNNGVILNGTTLTTDRNGNQNSAYMVDGVNCPDARGLALPCKIDNSKDYTLSIWFQSIDSTKTYQEFLNSSPHWFITASLNYFTPTSISSFIGNGDGWILNNYFSIVNQHNWHNLIITKSSTEIKYYIDGVLSQTIGIPEIVNKGSFTIILGAISINGGSSCYETFKGRVDDFRAYSRILPKAEITYLATH